MQELSAGVVRARILDSSAPKVYCADYLLASLRETLHPQPADVGSASSRQHQSSAQDPKLFEQHSQKLAQALLELEASVSSVVGLKVSLGRRAYVASLFRA